MDSLHKNDFARVMAALAETLREQISDIAIEGYFSALRDCNIQDLIAAADRLSQTARWFPKPAEWKEQARIVARDRLQKALPDAKETHFGATCVVCQDEGWICATCGKLDCDKDAAEHERRMKPCPCRGTNDAYQRKNAHKGAA